MYESVFALVVLRHDGHFFHPGAHCLEPVVPLPEFGLEHFGWDGNPIEVNQSIAFRCRNGMKVEDDIGLEFQYATCQPENKFDEPEWKKCVEST